MYFVLFMFVGYRCVLFRFMWDIDVFCFVLFHVGYLCILFCLRLYGILMYFVLFMFMWDIDVFCFVYVYVGYRCILFCLR